MNVRELSDLLKVDKIVIYRLIKKGIIDAHILNGKIEIKAQDIKRDHIKA